MSPTFPVAVSANCKSFQMQIVRSIRGGYTAQLLSESEILRSQKHQSLQAAKGWLVLEARSLEYTVPESVIWKEIALPITPPALVFISSLAVCYAFPTLIEYLSRMAGGRWAYLLIGDLCAYLIIFFVGYRKLAISSYIAARVTELLLLRSGFLSLNAMLWLTDAVPGVLASILICRKVVFLPRLANPGGFATKHADSTQVQSHLPSPVHD